MKTFMLETTSRLEFLCAEYGFTGPEVVPDDTGVYPLLRRLRYQRAGLAVEISLVLSCVGEEHVTTGLVPEGRSGSVHRTHIGSSTAHTGYQMSRALDQRADAIRSVLRERIQPCTG